MCNESAIKSSSKLMFIVYIDTFNDMIGSIEVDTVYFNGDDGIFATS